MASLVNIKTQSSLKDMGSKARIPGGVSSRPPLFQTQHDCRGLAKKMFDAPQKKSTRHSGGSATWSLWPGSRALWREAGGGRWGWDQQGKDYSGQGSKCRAARPILSCSLTDLEQEVKLKALKL